MKYDNDSFELVDAFLALKDVDDDIVEGMLKHDREVREGKAFSVTRGSTDLEAAKKFMDESASDDDEVIEVIDVDADSVDHIKNNSEYVGQAILSCNRCRANRFIDMDLLEAAEGDEEVFNINDECPHCHDAGSGYELIGQVGKVEKPVEDVVDDVPEAEADNDEATDEVAFENDIADVEADAEVDTAAEIEAEETPEVEFASFEEEETDGMETDTSEDELDDLDLPELGDEVDSDDTEKDDDDDVKESLNEAAELTGNAAEAWMMNQVITHMNNEDAYYGSWLYTWPDGETKEMCYYDFSDQDDFDDLEETYFRTYQQYHSDGLYNAPSDVYEYARATDRKLGLSAIENIPESKPIVRESLETSLVSDIVKNIIDPEYIDTVVVTDGERVIYEGSFEDLPRNLYGAQCKYFDVADGYLSCNIDLEETFTNSPLGRFLDKFGDDATEKVTLWDQATNDEVFTGTKDEAIKRYGNFEFSSIEAPSVLRLSINGPEFVSQTEIEGDEVITDLENLANKVLKENNMSVYRSKNSNTNEFWVKHSIEHLEDVELIYEQYVKPTENSSLIKEFKQLTGYSNPLEEAFEAGFNAAQKANSIKRDSQIRERRAPRARKAVNEAGPSRDQMINALKKAGKHYNFNKYTDAQIFRMYQKYVLSAPAKKTAEPESNARTCEKCGKRLNDSGSCPACDHGEEELNEAINSFNSELSAFYDWIQNYRGSDLFDAFAEEFSDENEELEMDKILAWLEEYDSDAYHDFIDIDAEVEAPKLVENIRSFKNRKDLAAAVQECKNNSRPYTIKRSLTEGYRYDLIEQVASDRYTFDDLYADIEAKEKVEEGIIGKFLFDTSLAHSLYDEFYQDLTAAIKAGDKEKALSIWTELKTDFDTEPTMKKKWAKEFVTAQEERFADYKAQIDALAENLNEENELVPAGNRSVQFTGPQQQVMNEIQRIAEDTAEAIQRHYGIEANPAIIVADILRDLQLISGDVSVDELGDSLGDRATAQMFNSYNQFYEMFDQLISMATGSSFRTTPQMKLRQAFQMLKGPNFSTEGIDAAIGSTAFLRAAQGGNIPFIADNDIPLLTEMLESCCETCGCSPCECVNEDTSVEELDALISQDEEELEVDTDAFDKSVNEYFDNAYEDTVLYITESGHVGKDGTIILEGRLQLEEQLENIEFTLKPQTQISESLSSGEMKLEDVLSETFTVTNNLSEEIFEFKFKD